MKYHLLQNIYHSRNLTQLRVDQMNHTICLPLVSFIENLNIFKWPWNLMLSNKFLNLITISSLCSKSLIGFETD